MASESKATTVWQGDLARGNGIASAASGAIGDLKVTWPARVERTEGTTSPEELLAASHASCFCMALAHALGEGGNLAERIEATATVEFVPGEGVKSSRLVLTASVPGLERAEFDKNVEAAEEGCPISGALRGNVDLSVEATLEETPGVL